MASGSLPRKHSWLNFEAPEKSEWQCFIQPMTEGAAAGLFTACLSACLHLFDGFQRDPSELRQRARRLQSAPDWIRTSDLRFRRPALYPAELRARVIGD